MYINSLYFHSQKHQNKGKSEKITKKPIFFKQKQQKGISPDRSTVTAAHLG